MGHTVRVRGGNRKFRALRLDKATLPGDLNAVPARPVSLMLSTMPQTMNWSVPRLWSRTLLLSLITPFRQWYESHYALPLNRKKGTKMTEAEELALNKPRSKKTEKKYKLRQRVAKIETALEEQFLTG